ncbi:MAG: hypothetical protein E6Q75_02470 [Rheinheimera sp.]|nr:MAG: hypothetical protein E6Q75_02470 [Rheinheimera sp.]
MPASLINVPGISFATTDRGGVYMGKLNAIAAAIDTAINGFNAQLAAANDAQLHAAALSDSLATAAASATKAGDWAEKAVDVIVETGKYSAKHHATKAAASASTASGHVTTAAGHVTTALNHATKAGDWAEKAENVLVETGKYSAKHHAIKAAASASTASGHVTTAAGHVATASNHATKAGDWAEKAENSLVEAGMYSAKHHAAKAAASATTASGHATTAAGHVSTAQQWASANENVVVSSGKYSANHYALKAEYWAQQAAAASTGAMVFVGGYNASSNTWPASAAAGYTYRISTAGTLGPFADSVTRSVTPGDIIIKRSDGQWDHVDAQDSDVVKTSRTVNGYALTANITLTAADVGARASSWVPAFTDVTGTAAVAQIPALPASKITSGTLPITYGGTGRADGKAIALATARTIAGVSFDGSANITLTPANVGAKPANDSADNTDIITTAGTISRKEKVTRCGIAASSSFPVAIASSGYGAGDSIELSIAVASGAVVTLTATQSMGVTGGTAGTSHTITGPVHISVVAVFNGTTWQLFVS